MHHIKAFDIISIGANISMDFFGHNNVQMFLMPEIFGTKTIWPSKTAKTAFITLPLGLNIKKLQMIYLTVHLKRTHIERMGEELIAIYVSEKMSFEDLESTRH